MTETFRTACEAQGYRVHTDSDTVSGMCNGVAFRASLARETVELSVNLSAKRLPKLVQAWQSLCAGLTAQSGDECRVTLTCPTLATWEAERLLSLLDTVTAQLVQGAEKSFSDRHEKERDPVLAYVRGWFGALCGAVVGTLPWLLVRWWIGWDVWLLLGLVGVASFYGYRLFRGAHSTGYAMTWVVLFSLLAVTAMVGFQSAFAIATMLASTAEPENGSFVQQLMSPLLWNVVARLFVNRAFWLSQGTNLLFPLALCAAGLVGIRRQILIYTHEGAFLRRGRKRR